MYALDFEYDGGYLSDFGFILCDFNGASGAQISSIGSNITFTTAPRRKGRKHSFVSSEYKETIQCSFHICKDPDQFDDMRISYEEYRDLMRWLNRHEFCRFRVIYDDKDDPTRELSYFNASFNILKITIGEILYGLELQMETDAPYGYGREQSYYKKLTGSNGTFVVYDLSDDIGYTYVSVKATCSSAGDLVITNTTTGHETVIKNCSSGEVITIDGDALVITSSLESHKICKDFNYVFPRICNTFHNRENVFTVSLPCRIELAYAPNIKDVF